MQSNHTDSEETAKLLLITALQQNWQSSEKDTIARLAEMYKNFEIATSGDASKINSKKPFGHALYALSRDKVDPSGKPYQYDKEAIEFVYQQLLRFLEKNPRLSSSTLKPEDNRLLQNLKGHFKSYKDEKKFSQNC